MQRKEELVHLNTFQYSKHDAVKDRDTLFSSPTHHVENSSEMKHSFGLSILDISMWDIGFASYITGLLSHCVIEKKS